MKTTLKFVSVTMLSFVMLTWSCSTSDDSPNNSTSTQEVVNTAQSGDWIITYFYDTDSEETSNFTGYVFSFGSNGVLTATNGTTTVTGTWSVTTSNSTDDSPDDDLDFNIDFSAPADFAELTDDWDIISISSTQIQLIDVSGGNGGTDYLTFMKQ